MGSVGRPKRFLGLAGSDCEAALCVGRGLSKKAFPDEGYIAFLQCSEEQVSIMSLITSERNAGLRQRTKKSPRPGLALVLALALALGLVLFMGGTASAVPPSTSVPPAPPSASTL